MIEVIEWWGRVEGTRSMGLILSDESWRLTIPAALLHMDLDFLVLITAIFSSTLEILLPG